MFSSTSSFQRVIRVFVFLSQQVHFSKCSVVDVIPHFTTRYCFPFLILPWFSCFKTPWYTMLFCYAMPWHNYIRGYNSNNTVYARCLFSEQLTSVVLTSVVLTSIVLTSVVLTSIGRILWLTGSQTAFCLP